MRKLIESKGLKEFWLVGFEDSIRDACKSNPAQCSSVHVCDTKEKALAKQGTSLYSIESVWLHNNAVALNSAIRALHEANIYNVPFSWVK